MNQGGERLSNMKQMRSMQTFVEYLIERGVQPQTCIDVGACYGTPEIFRTLPNAYHIYFEPNPTMEERLKELTEKFPGEYHIMALAAEEGRMLLTFPEDKPEEGQLSASSGTGAGIETRVSTLDNVLERHRLQGPVLLKTDCQGYDLDVLKGARSVLKQVDVIISEANLYHAGGDPSRPVFSDIVTFLAEQEFEVFDILSYNKRPLDSSLGYVDLAFVRRDGPLWSRHQWT